MDFEQMQSDFSAMGSKSLSKEQLAGMMSVNQQPVIKRIRLQLVIETILMGLFLAVYYNFFDGQLKSTGWNIALILGAMLVLVHNLLGLNILQLQIFGDNLQQSLQTYHNRIQRFAWVSVLSRILAVGLIFGFFLSEAQALSAVSIWIWLGMGLVFCLQLGLLLSIWRKRLHRIEEILKQFHS